MQNRRHWERELSEKTGPPSKQATQVVSALQRTVRKLYLEPLGLPTDGAFKLYCEKVRGRDAWHISVRMTVCGGGYMLYAVCLTRSIL